jgi:ABC-2 type transport system ATP-binding protein
MKTAGALPIEVRNLEKSYGSVRAVRGLSFTVERGEIFGLIGPDGGGKTTIMRTVVSLLGPDAGEVSFQGRRVDKNPGWVRSRIGYMPQRFSLYQDLTVEENLLFFADIFTVPRDGLPARMEKLYGFSGLRPFKNRRAGRLSGGMKQKLALSCMLVHTPEVIVLDEPTFGVDPVSRHEFWKILKSLRDQGTAVLVSTAYSDEAGLCDRVALVFKGRILALDAPDRLKRLFTEPLYVVKTDSPHTVHDALARSGLCVECHFFGDGVHFTLASGVSTDTIGAALNESGASWREIRAAEPGIEDLFLKLMKE